MRKQSHIEQKPVCAYAVSCIGDWEKIMQVEEY